MLKRIKEITAENFSEAVNYACDLNRRMNTGILARKIILPLGSLIFALNGFFLFMGLFFSILGSGSNLVVATDVFPFFSKYWNIIFGFFGTLTDLLYVKIILILGFLFVVPFLLCGIITIIVFHCTKSTPLSITGSVAKSAKQLHSYVRNSPYFENSVELLDEVHALWRRLTGIISGICIAVILLYSQGLSISQSKDFLAVFSAIFKSENYADEIVMYLFIGGTYYIVYAVLHFVFSATILRFHTCYTEWSKFSNETERYWVSVDPEERKARKLKEEAEKERRSKKSYSSYSSSSSSYSSSSLSYDQKFSYINSNFDGEYSFGAIEHIENDPNLTPSQKEEMKIFLRAFGD